ncbi:MAG: serine hydrolase [Salibacteraceae bacterium]|nr:serine hydrolase [Salibacteraceae bacterium]
MKFKTILIAQIFWAFFSCTGDEESSVPKIPSANFKIELTDQQKKLAKSIDSIASKRHKQGIFNGVVLFAEYGLPIYSKAFGFANFKTKELLTEHSVFQLASVSKMFTATAILLLQQKGYLSINDSIHHIIPNFPYKGLIIRHLLTHRSGLPRYMVVTDEHWPRDSMLTNEDMHAVMVAHSPKRYFSPDFRFNYQNTNYAYLALIVERVSGQSFDNFVRDHIFEPLGMYNSRVYSGKKQPDIAGAVVGHIYRRPRIVLPQENYINGVAGDKGVYASVGDLLKFDQALYTDTFLTAESKQLMFHPWTKWRRAGKDSYGFGWRISNFEKDNLVYHYGWWNGFKTSFMRYTNSKRTIIILTNRDRKLTLTKELQALLFPE